MKKFFKIQIFFLFIVYIFIFNLFFLNKIRCANIVSYLGLKNTKDDQLKSKSFNYDYEFKNQDLNKNNQKIKQNFDKEFIKYKN